MRQDLGAEHVESVTPLTGLLPCCRTLGREAVFGTATNGIFMAALILIVDDDPVQRRLLEAMARRFGYEVESAESGAEGLARLEAPDRPAVDLIVLDLVMPDLDGMGVLTRMRQRGIDASKWDDINTTFTLLADLGGTKRPSGPRQTENSWPPSY